MHVYRNIFEKWPWYHFYFLQSKWKKQDGPSMPKYVCLCVSYHLLRILEFTQDILLVLLLKIFMPNH